MSLGEVCKRFNSVYKTIPHATEEEFNKGTSSEFKQMRDYTRFCQLASLDIYNRNKVMGLYPEEVTEDMINLIHRLNKRDVEKDANNLKMISSVLQTEEICKIAVQQDLNALHYTD